MFIYHVFRPLPDSDILSGQKIRDLEGWIIRIAVLYPFKRHQKDRFLGLTL